MKYKDRETRKTTRKGGGPDRLGFRGRILRALCFAILAIALPETRAWAQAPDIVERDLARRSPEIHWPAELSPATADMFSHNEILIQAGCNVVWRHLVEAAKWPQWYPNSHNVQIPDERDGRLHDHSRFAWTTFGVHIDSTVAEYVPAQRLGWFGQRPGVRAYHTWLLAPVHDGCFVLTEEATKGTAAVSGRKSHPNALHEGHELWLTRLKAISEH